LVYFLCASGFDCVPISALRQIFRDEKYIQTLNDYRYKPTLFGRLCRPMSKGRSRYPTWQGFVRSNLDGFVKSLFGPIFVTPAKGGIHPAEGGTAFAGGTAFPTFYEVINLDYQTYRIFGRTRRGVWRDSSFIGDCRAIQLGLWRSFELF
jgi:hypothetical protein